MAQEANGCPHWKEVSVFLGELHVECPTFSGASIGKQVVRTFGVPGCQRRLSSGVNRKDVVVCRVRGRFSTLADKRDPFAPPQQVKLDLPPREEVKILVKLTRAQHLVYRHLLVIQDRKLADAIRVEGQKHDGVGAVRGGDGGPMSPSRAVAGESCGGGRGDANGECGEDEMAAVSKREDEHYQKLMTLLVHLRWVGGGP